MDWPTVQRSPRAEVSGTMDSAQRRAEAGDSHTRGISRHSSRLGHTANASIRLDNGRREPAAMCSMQMLDIRPKRGPSLCIEAETKDNAGHGTSRLAADYGHM